MFLLRITIAECLSLSNSGLFNLCVLQVFSVTKGSGSQNFHKFGLPLPECPDISFSSLIFYRQRPEILCEARSMMYLLFMFIQVFSVTKGTWAISWQIFHNFAFTMPDFDTLSGTMKLNLYDPANSLKTDFIHDQDKVFDLWIWQIWTDNWFYNHHITWLGIGESRL